MTKRDRRLWWAFLWLLAVMTGYAPVELSRYILRVLSVTEDAWLRYVMPMELGWTWALWLTGLAMSAVLVRWLFIQRQAR